MRTRIVSLVLAAAALLGTPEAGRAQFQEVPPTDFTGPFSHPRYESGGFFVAAEANFWRLNRTISAQNVAYRGFYDTDGSITGKTPGTFVGSGAVALSTEQVQGSGNYTPGETITMGYRFEDGLTVTASWLHLSAQRYTAQAALIPPSQQIGQGGADSYLSSPVSNFPLAFSGNAFNVVGGNPGATYGIWNAASFMSLEYLQRFDMVEIMARVPIWQTDSLRTYGRVGPRTYQLFDRLNWTTIDADVLGNSTPQTTALYTNFVTNNLWGVNLGCGAEWFMGENPLGAFSCSVEGNAGLYADYARSEASYNLGDGTVARIRERQFLTIAPATDVTFKLHWYPWEGIQLTAGYQFLAIFNTVASPRPIDFNYGTLDPGYNAWTTRWMHGLNVGLSFVF